MIRTPIRIGLLLVCMSCCSCGSKEESAPPSEPEETKVEQPVIPPVGPIKAPLIGQLSGSGYTPESIRVQIGPEESLRELHTPAKGMQFLFVRWTINGTAVLVPKDYRIVMDKKQYAPHAIGFGRPNGVYSSVEYFVGDKVDLAPGADDQVLHDGERIQKCELKNPIVFLIYEVPQSLNPTLWHGTQSFPLQPNFASLAKDLSGAGGTLTASTPLNLTDPNAATEEFSAELLSTTRTRIELNSSPADVVVVTLGLSSPKAGTIELKKSELNLHGAGGSGQAGTVYFHFSPSVATLSAGSSFTEGETYQGKDLIGLASGSFRLPLSQGTSVTATLIFPDPKLGGGLELKLSSTVAVEVPEPVNPLGKFPPPLEKMPGMVAWAPLIGTPTEAGYLPGQASLAGGYKDLTSPAPANPGDGLRYLMVRFRVQQESLFVPIDYRLAEQESRTIYRPVAVAFGGSAVYVKGLDYEKFPLTFGAATEPRQQGGKLTGWTLKTPNVTLLYEVAPSREFVFLHGSTQFVIEL